MLTFDRKQVMDQIEPLPKRLRVAFAAACTQRQLLNYIRASAANPIGDPGAVPRILRELWDSAERNTFELEKIQVDLAICEELIADYYNGKFKGFGFAEDALASLAYALDTALSRGSQETMWAAERACNALFAYIVKRFDLDAGTPSALSHINSFPIKQAELSRQQADLAELHAAAKKPGTETAVIARIKHRAEHDAASFFG